MSNALAIPDTATSIPTEIDTTESSVDLAEMWRLRFKHNMSINQIADRMGCHKTTVWRKLERYVNMLPNAEQIKMYQQNKAGMLDALELKVYEEMSNPDKLKDASFNNLAYGFQNICTQNRLEKGLATQIVDTVAIVGSIDDLRKREDEILKVVQSRVVQDVVPNKDNVK